MTHARGMRSNGSRKRRIKDWESLRAEREVLRRIVLDFSFHDLENGDKVFTPEFQQIVIKKLKEVSPTKSFPIHLVSSNRFGDVLNRFPLRVQTALNNIPYRLWPLVRF